MKDVVGLETGIYKIFDRNLFNKSFFDSTNRVDLDNFHK